MSLICLFFFFFFFFFFFIFFTMRSGRLGFFFFLRKSSVGSIVESLLSNRSLPDDSFASTVRQFPLEEIIIIIITFTWHTPLNNYRTAPREPDQSSAGGALQSRSRRATLKTELNKLLICTLSSASLQYLRTRMSLNCPNVSVIRIL